MSERLDMLVESVGKQVAEFAERIDEEGITDTTELNAFSKLANTYNRLIERAGKSRVKKDIGFPDVDEMDDHEFLDRYYAGELHEWISTYTDRGDSDPSHARMLLISEENWIAYGSRKPKLIIPAGGLTI